MSENWLNGRLQNHVFFLLVVVLFCTGMVFVQVLPKKPTDRDINYFSLIDTQMF